MLQRAVGKVVFVSGFLLFLGYAAAGTARAAEPGVSRARIGNGQTAVLRDGRNLFLECAPPAGTPATTFYTPILADPEDLKNYVGRRAVAIPFARLSGSTQRAALLGIFTQDVVDEKGWLHIVTRSDESLATLCEWLTGDAGNVPRVVAANSMKSQVLLVGQRVLIPLALLRDPLKAPTPDRRPPPLSLDPAKPAVDPVEPVLDLSNALADLDVLGNELEYGEDKEGRYAVYRLKPGEALYTAVVVRFTDFSVTKDVLAACEIVQKRSNIKDVHGMKPGQKVIIPEEMLSARFRPKGSVERREYEEVILEAKRLRDAPVRSQDLEGVVVVLDPGHGGRDHGAVSEKYALYEDELNYDIACRVKKILESRTRAKVYMTMIDPDQGFEPTSRTRFVHDTDEEVMTTPRYGNGLVGETDATVSANLRWCLANTIFLRERARGIDPRKIVFTSFHCDALFNSSLRGTMVYIPGASLRRDGTCSGPTYARYQEVKEGGRAVSTMSERRRDEALSRNFAEVLLDELGRHRIRRHLEGDPIRSQIRRSPTEVWLPAVLKNNMIPTKILVEAANLTNSTDCERLADPEWRQTFAEAYVQALIRFYQ